MKFKKTSMTYAKALEMDESKAGLDLTGMGIADLLTLLDEIPGWDYDLGEESVTELASRAGIDVEQYFAQPEYCDRAGDYRENPYYDESAPHGSCYDDLWSDAAEALGYDIFAE